jgi:predicted nucleic acid-binding protein
LRVFLDTNVLVSAFASRGICADLLRYVLVEHDLLVGEVVLVELERVLLGRIKVPR